MKPGKNDSKLLKLAMEIGEGYAKKEVLKILEWGFHQRIKWSASIAYWCKMA